MSGRTAFHHGLEGVLVAWVGVFSSRRAHVDIFKKKSVELLIGQTSHLLITY